MISRNCFSFYFLSRMASCLQRPPRRLSTAGRCTYIYNYADNCLYKREKKRIIQDQNTCITVPIRKILVDYLLISFSFMFKLKFNKIQNCRNNVQIFLTVRDGCIYRYKRQNICKILLLLVFFLHTEYILCRKGIKSAS